VFVLPAHEAESPAAGVTVHQGYQVAEWQAAGMRFWAVSDISREDMASFKAAMKAAA